MERLELVELIPAIQLSMFESKADSLIEEDDLGATSLPNQIGDAANP